MDFSMDNIADPLGNLREEDLQSLKDTAASLFGDAQPDAAQDAADPGIDPALLRKMTRIMQAMQAHQDSRSALIHALKPYLSAPRQKRADDAMQFLRLLDILPMLNN